MPRNGHNDLTFIPKARQAFSTLRTDVRSLFVESYVLMTSIYQVTPSHAHNTTDLLPHQHLVRRPDFRLSVGFWHKLRPPEYRPVRHRHCGCRYPQTKRFSNCNLSSFSFPQSYNATNSLTHGRLVGTVAATRSIRCSRRHVNVITVFSHNGTQIRLG